MSEPCKHDRGYFRDLLTGAPPERRCMDCNELLPSLPTVADLQAQVERLTQDKADALVVAATVRDVAHDMEDERDEANRQLAAVVEGLEVIVEESELRPEQELIGCKAVARALLADIPAAAQEIGAKLERAEYVAPLYEKFRLASARLNIVANWLENTHAPGSEAARSARIYADAAKKVLDDGLNALVKEVRPNES